MDTSPTPPTGTPAVQPGDRQDNSNVFGKRERGRVISVTHPESGTNLHSDINFSLQQEIETMGLLLELYGALHNVHTGKDMTFIDQVIKDKFPQWDRRKRNFILYEIEQKERAELENVPETISFTERMAGRKNREKAKADFDKKTAGEVPFPELLRPIPYHLNPTSRRVYPENGYPDHLPNPP